jgi:WD40 repeat protein
MADVFVSYSRRDSEFVAHLVDSITARGKAVWLDTEGIADAEVFPEAIKRAIEGSDAFVFVITPSAVESAYCENEVEYACEMQKRIVPVLRGPVPDPELPPEIRDRVWIPFVEDQEFDAGLSRLLNALDTDLEAAKAHTRWLVKALEWDSERRDKSFLLRGSELKAAEAWMASRPEDAEPAPTHLQREYLLASREAAARRQRTMMGGAVAVAAVSIGLLIFALISRGQAVSERVSARAQALAAESQAQLPNDPEISVILGMRAVKTQATPQTLFALRAAIDASPLEQGLPTINNPGNCGSNGGLAAALSPDGREVAEGTCTGLVRILDTATGRVLRSENVGDNVTSLAYAPNGSVLALATGDGVSALNPQTGAAVKSGIAAGLGGVGRAVNTTSLAFSPDGRRLAVDSPDGLAIGALASSRSVVVNASLGGNIAFSPDGRLLFAGAQDASLHVYDVSSGRLIHRILGPPQQQSNSWPDVVAVSPDGKSLAIAYPVGSNAAVSIYSVRTWRKQFTLMTLPEVEISALEFSPDSARLAIGAEDGVAGVWSVSTRQELVSYDGPTAAIDSIQFTPDGDSVLTASDDGIARLWRAIGVEQSLQTLPLAAGPQQIAFDGGRIETVASTQPTVFSAPIATGQPVRRTTFPGVRQVVLSPDGHLALGLGSSAAPLTDGYLAAQAGPLTVWDTRTARVVRKVPSAAMPTVNLSLPPIFSWNDASIAFDGGSTGFDGVQGGVIMSLTTGQTVQLQDGPVFETCGSTPESFAFSRDDRRIAGAYFCGYAAVWDTRTGRLLRQVNQGGEVSAVDLSPDGSRLLVSSSDSRATIWSVATGRRLVNLIGDTQGVEGAAFSPDGSLVATASLDDTVRIWNARTGQELRVLSFPDAQSLPVFNASGSQFAVAESDPPGTQDNVRVFDTCPACTNARALLGLAASHVTKQLTVLERTVVNGA